jgi:hypothetical protein
MRVDDWKTSEILTLLMAGGVLTLMRSRAVLGLGLSLSRPRGMITTRSDNKRASREILEPD